MHISMGPTRIARCCPISKRGSLYDRHFSLRDLLRRRVIHRRTLKALGISHGIQAKQIDPRLFV